MLARSDKDVVVDELSKSFDKAVGVMFLDFTGMTVSEANSFRRRLQKDDIQYRVVKNTLVQRALMGRPCEDAGKCLKGSPTGVVIGFEDPVQSARVVFDFIKECKHLRVKGGIVENRSISSSEADTLSKMPSRGQIQAGIVGLAMSPGRKLASQIKSPAGRIVGAIAAFVKKLETSGS
jgi:large subunit ribosomal protein L10